MLIVEIFYCTFWISAISIIWFYTDWFIHYSQLLKIAENVRLKYTSFIKNDPTKYFPDFLYDLSLGSNNRYFKFILKMVSCPLCLIFWLSVMSALVCSNIIIAAPVYILSLFIVLQIKKLL
jgi:hypothetical protein